MTESGDIVPTDAFHDVMNFREASDEQKIKNMHEWFWIFCLLGGGEKESSKVREAYDMYVKFSEL